MAAERASVVVSGRDAARGAQVVNLIEAAGGDAAFVAADLDGSAGRSAQLAADAAAAFGPVTVLVNNAGIYPPTERSQPARTPSIESLLSTSRRRSFSRLP